MYFVKKNELSVLPSRGIALWTFLKAKKLFCFRRFCGMILLRKESFTEISNRLQEITVPCRSIVGSILKEGFS